MKQPSATFQLVSENVYSFLLFLVKFSLSRVSIDRHGKKRDWNHGCDSSVSLFHIARDDTFIVLIFRYVLYIDEKTRD